MGAMAKIAEQWEPYERRVIPIGAPAVQRRESKRAFYAGAQALLGTMLVMLEPGSEPTEKDLAMMDEIAAELTAFSQAVRRGDA